MGRFNYYAVVNGKDGFTGLTTSWEECSKYVKNIDNVRYKGFSQQEDAEAWIKRIQNKLAEENINIPDKLANIPDAPSDKKVRSIKAMGNPDLKEMVDQLNTKISKISEEMIEVTGLLNAILEQFDDKSSDVDEDALPFS